MSGAARYWGKYRGRVIDNVDPLGLGRIVADVPALAGGVANWALPCTPYAGPNVGFYAIPPIGAKVWIEFEGGDPNYPIWVGCFWGEGDVPQEPALPTPDVKTFRTDTVSLVLSDVPGSGGVQLHYTPPGTDTPLSITLNAIGVTIVGSLMIEGAATMAGGIAIVGGGTIDGAPIL